MNRFTFQVPTISGNHCNHCSYDFVDLYISVATLPLTSLQENKQEEREKKKEEKEKIEVEKEEEKIFWKPLTSSKVHIGGC